MPRFDYECRDCEAIFEEWDEDPKCILCGSRNIVKIFITPPGTKSDRTKHMDTTMGDLMAAHGMTDYQNDPSRKHDAPNPMRVSSLDPKKQIADQVADGINKIRGPVPMNHPRMGKVTQIPVMDAGSGESFQQVAKANRAQNYRQRETRIIHSIDRSGRAR